MKTYVALLRGINVGGKNLLPMKDLVALLEALGAQGVRTYIQSGNAVFRHRDPSTKLVKRVRAAIHKSHGFDPHVLLTDLSSLERAAAANPFPEGESDPKSLHLFFLSGKPKKPNMDALEELRAPRERFHLGALAFYLHAPDGIARSKLAARAEKALGVPVTARNWRTVGKVIELAKQCA